MAKTEGQRTVCSNVSRNGREYHYGIYAYIVGDCPDVEQAVYGNVQYYEFEGA
ncbi:hypothetical protein D3C80_2229800 [compost metagenome]